MASPLQALVLRAVIEFRVLVILLLNTNKRKYGAYLSEPFPRCRNKLTIKARISTTISRVP
jgi:hypothetical protein